MWAKIGIPNLPLSVNYTGRTHNPKILTSPFVNLAISSINLPPCSALVRFARVSVQTMAVNSLVASDPDIRTTNIQS